VAAHWLACRVTPLKKQIHLGWEYNELQDPTQETTEKIEQRWDIPKSSSDEKIEQLQEPTN
jgi:hypothetical protein